MAMSCVAPAATDLNGDHRAIAFAAPSHLRHCMEKKGPPSRLPLHAAEAFRLEQTVVLTVPFRPTARLVRALRGW